jgi:hypothetical protein
MRTSHLAKSLRQGEKAAGSEARGASIPDRCPRMCNAMTFPGYGFKIPCAYTVPCPIHGGRPEDMSATERAEVSG